MGSVTTWWRWWRWCPTSDEILLKAEVKMLQGLCTKYKSYIVPIANGNQIRTIETIPNCKSKRLPLLLLHGFGAGVALWVLNLDHLSKNQKVYAIDLLGFGRSSRPQFPSGEEAETLFIKSIEEWRQEVGIEKFVLLGHSFGAYLAASYAIKHPERVRHLILADPWGMPEKNAENEKSFQLPLWAKLLASVISLGNPLTALRLSGPLGPHILRMARPDLKRKFSSLFDDSQVTDYIYHVLVQDPSGEAAFVSLTIPYGWARYPMLNRLEKQLDSNVPISIFYGSRSWMHIKSGLELKSLRPNSYVHFQLIPNGSHHCYADEAHEFNTRVELICETVEKSLDTYEELHKRGDEETYDIEKFDNFGSFLKPL